MKFINLFFQNVSKSLLNLDKNTILKTVELLRSLRKRKGRLFIVGVGGSAGNASHAVNDFRKLCDIDAYTPVDNISEITAKTNDEGFDTIFDTYLKLSKFNKKDVLMVFSVGGGNIKKNVSVNIARAIKYAKNKRSSVICAWASHNSLVLGQVKVNEKKLVTPISETFQVLIWHLLVSHPRLQLNKTKW